MRDDVGIFVSHSSADVKLAEALVDLLKAALRLPSANIRCTSVEGHRLPGGATVEEQLRREVLGSKVFVALVTPRSVDSTYVLFEMGARWGAQRNFIPVIVSGDASVLKGPLAAFNALDCSVPAQVLQLVGNIAEELEIQSEPPHAFHRSVENLVRAAESSRPAEEPAKISLQWTAARLGLTKFHVEVLFWICLWSEYATAEKIADDMGKDVVDVMAAADLLIEKGAASIDQLEEPPAYRVTAAGVDVVRSSLSVK